MGKVASAAKVNHSLIFHHFKNKQGLWVAVKESIVCKKAPPLPNLDLSFKTFLSELITSNILYYKKNKDFIKIVNWQRLEANNKNLPQVGETKSTHHLLDALKHYQSKGDITPNTRLEFFLTMLASIINVAALDPIIFIQSTEDRTAYINFCVETLMKKSQTNH